MKNLSNLLLSSSKDTARGVTEKSGPNGIKRQIQQKAQVSGDGMRNRKISVPASNPRTHRSLSGATRRKMETCEIFRHS